MEWAAQNLKGSLKDVEQSPLRKCKGHCMVPHSALVKAWLLGAYLLWRQLFHSKADCARVQPTGLLRKLITSVF